MGHHHGAGAGTVTPGQPRVALVGNPNSGKSSVFNALTGLRAKTGNYPGITVARYEGTCTVGAGADAREITIEDLPGTYSLEPMSPDEQIVADAVEGRIAGLDRPDAVVAMLDVTTLRRSLGFLAQLLQVDRPICVVATFTDELTARQGRLDIDALSRALGVPVVAVVGHRRTGLDSLTALLGSYEDWAAPVVPPPTEPHEVDAWIDSVLASAEYRQPVENRTTQAIDRVLLHPVWGSLIFAAVMFAFFQVIFTVAAPLQGYVEQAFAWLGDQVQTHVGNELLASFLADALLGGVGGVLVFLPQILLLFLMISFLESVGYLSRAAFLMDRVMASAGLEGRAFVAMLSSWACAIPGIMATRTLPSAKDRIATMMAAPLMTCSARLPVYVLLIGLLVPSELRFGPIGAQGAIMFALYVLGAGSAMATAWLFKKLTSRGQQLMPFYLEMPPYRFPTARLVLTSMWESAKAFLRKVTSIIMVTTALLWVLLALPARTDADLIKAGVDTGDAAATSSYVIDHSYGAAVGRAVQPVFDPLGFDWRLNIGVLASLSARETFVATLGQITAAENPEDPQKALSDMRYTDGDRAGEPVFTAPTIAALLLFFVYALQCMSTIGIMRRETGGWKWPGIAFGYMFALAWVAAFAGHTIVGALT